LEVINGPEDGSIFHLIRSPIDLGADPQCGIILQLDKGISALHARLTVVSDGYRVRCYGGCSVWVNGKRAGGMRSRLLRSGDVLRVGETELAIYCAAEGLARRSKGIKSESDLSWALHLLWRGIAHPFRGTQP